MGQSQNAYETTKLRQTSMYPKIKNNKYSKEQGLSSENQIHRQHNNYRHLHNNYSTLYILRCSCSEETKTLTTEISSIDHQPITTTSFEMESKNNNNKFIIDMSKKSSEEIM